MLLRGSGRLLNFERVAFTRHCVDPLLDNWGVFWGALKIEWVKRLAVKTSVSSSRALDKRDVTKVVVKRTGLTRMMDARQPFIVGVFDDFEGKRGGVTGGADQA